MDSTTKFSDFKAEPTPPNPAADTELPLINDLYVVSTESAKSIIWYS